MVLPLRILGGPGKLVKVVRNVASELDPGALSIRNINASSRGVPRDQTFF